MHGAEEVIVLLVEHRSSDSGSHPRSYPGRKDGGSHWHSQAQKESGTVSRGLKLVVNFRNP